MSKRIFLHSDNVYRLKMTHCFLFNYAGRLAVRIQPFRDKWRLKIRGAFIDFDNRLCYYIKGHTQTYDFKDLKFCIYLFNITVQIIIECFEDTFKINEDFTPLAMCKDFDSDLLDSIIL